MTLLVATAIGDTPDELYARARAAAEHADWIEVRLDGPSGLPWDLRAFFAFDKPCLATVRHADDGGRSHADDATRADLLRRALKAGARGIDVELGSDQLRALVDEARAADARVVLSHHDLSGTPSADVLLATLRSMRASGADWCKIATRVERPEHAVALVQAAQAARAEGIPCALMAVNDPFLRLLAPALGMALAYGSVPGATPGASGQVPLPELRAAHAATWPARARREAARGVFLLGHPVAHSKSPAMQDAAFAAAGIDARYVALDVPPSGLAAAIAGLKATNALGCNVTLPHKLDAVTMMDELDASAKLAMAVNTVVFRAGRAIGHNTDGPGAIDALREAGVAIRGARTLLLGAGGTAGALLPALRAAGADVTIANRTAARTISLDAPSIPWDRLADVMRNVDLLVNATSLGLHGESVPAPIERMPAGAAVLDCVYDDTPLSREAASRGLRVVRGEAMLLHQGARAFELWTGKPAPVAVMRATLEAGR